MAETNGFEMAFLCRVGRKTLTQSINDGEYCHDQ